jgi:hypothetical protein
VSSARFALPTTLPFGAGARTLVAEPVRDAGCLRRLPQAR